MKSLLYQPGVTVLLEPPGCSAGRVETSLDIRENGRLYRFVARDKVMPEDPYLVMVKATAFAVQTGEAYSGRSPDRSVRDLLIKDSVVV